ncbi:DNA ligase D [Rhodoplanes sp. TEM]|uniref:DNA ligase (ATP) n=1 Tax=Rhodoplanes tepidamans TaxID=200616 RepID=A0ABT5J706_RHOTP|nr:MULTISPECIES: DNA ligase D [Rhodoplanes]MDC7785445.1 DNA ligase D [Rhodoplanes tepidamans]MDC7985774.1 DNA ligase D [Rhodoplanes sp. TEM]MDQ0353101.1 bifunctional non-homologous end joining protein LigD [Rhodoplanes tepidamans]
MALDTYRQKRKFDVTPEPRGRRARGKGDSFVVQKHAARRLHYDFRLELDGVLKSWAVTRGPSLVPGEKRLAVETEDHPLEYGGFEGTIPAGQYGGGTVMLWDRGRWIPDGDPHVGLKKGHLQFTLEGEKLKGRWHLVRMHKRRGDRHDNWLLIKSEDEASRTAADPDLLEEKTLSVETGRSIDEIAAGKTPKRKTGVKAAAVWQSSRSEEPAKVPRKAPSERQSRPAPARAARAARGGKGAGGRASPHRETSTRSTAVPRPAPAKPGKAKTTSAAKRKSAASPMPDFVPPCLATLADAPPDAPGWIHEIKFDGYRIQARLEDGAVVLKTRKGLDWTQRFLSVARAVAALPAGTALIDGEIVVENASGISDFSALQAALEAGREDFVYDVFDLLHLDGRDLRDRPLAERKAALADLVAKAPGDTLLRFSDHLAESGAVVHEHACRMGLEGIVSKRSDAPYRSGRGTDWIKSKCADRQEFVVGGYRLATGSTRAVGALAVGTFQDGELTYVGRIGTGYTQKTAGELFRRLSPLEVATMPFARLPADERRRDMTWVEPELVIEAELRGRTGSGLLRHAAFKGIREDKASHEVLRERPIPVGEVQEQAMARAKSPRKKASPADTSSPRPGAGERARGGAAPPGAARLTNPQRVYWQDVDITKQGLADYYASVWDWIAPHVVRRPLALLRCPNGVGSECFVQKHSHATFDKSRILSVDDDGDELIAIETLDGLLALVQAGVLEVHVWGSTIDRVDVNDRLVFDLDPGPDVTWAAVVDGAREVRDRLAEMKLESFVKTSGGKGLHIVVPHDGADWTTAKEFSKRLAYAMAADAPQKYIGKMTKSARVGKIFVDYLRNGRGATAVAAYSPRARPGAPVSTPVAWNEVTAKLSPARWTVLNLMDRLKRLKADPWAGIAAVRQRLPGP